MKFLLDFSPALIFFGAYFASDIYTATIALIVSLFVLVLIYRFWEGKWHKTHLITACVALVLGSLTLAIRDPNFIMLKPTAVYLAFALALIGSHWIGQQPILQRLGQKQLQMPDAVWKKVNMARGLFFLFCAVLNLAIAYSFDEATWVKFKTFGFTALMFIFMLAHAPFIGRYLQEPETKTDDKELKDAVRDHRP